MALRTTPKTDTTLTPAQFRVLLALYRLLKDNPAPSIAELAEIAGEGGVPITVTSTTQHIGCLRRKGMVESTPHRTRSIRMTVAGRAELGLKAR